MTRRAFVRFLVHLGVVITAAAVITTLVIRELDRRDRQLHRIEPDMSLIATPDPSNAPQPARGGRHAK